MDRHLQLSQKLHELFDNKVRKISFNPSESVKLVYPCILYTFSHFERDHADDTNYLKRECYTITHIYLNSDEHLREEFLDKRNFLYCSFDRTFINDGLYHDVYKVYI